MNRIATLAVTRAALAAIRSGLKRWDSTCRGRQGACAVTCV